jgi:outer membrane protein
MNSLSVKSLKFLWASLCITIGLITPLHIHGQSASTNLTLNQALDIAREQSTGVRVTSLARQSAQLARTTAWNVLVPSISVTTGVTRSNTPPQVTIAPGMVMELSPWTALVQLDTQLVLNPALFNGLQNYNLELERSELNQEQTLQELELRVTQQFYQLLLLQEQLELLQAQVRSLEARRQDMEVMFNAGIIHELDLLQIQVGQERLKPQVIQLERTIQQAMHRFNLTLGLPLTTQFTLDGSITQVAHGIESTLGTVPAAVLSGANTSYRTDLRGLELNLRSLDNGLQANFRQNLPSIILGWSWQPVLSDPFSDSRFFTGDNWTDRGSFSLLVRLPLDVWIPNSSHRVQRRQMEIQKEQLILQTRQAEQAAELEITSLVQQLHSRIESLQALGRAVALAERSLLLTSQAYNLGTRSYSDLRDAENELLSTRLDLLVGQFETLMTWLDLNQALGGTLESISQSTIAPTQISTLTLTTTTRGTTSSIRNNHEN